MPIELYQNSLLSTRSNKSVKIRKATNKNSYDDFTLYSTTSIAQATSITNTASLDERQVRL